MSVTEFADVTKDKNRGITPKGGLYEFWTEDGAHVYLHDTDFRRLTYEPGRPSTLELEFVYHPQWTPPELSKTPVVIFRFDNVRIVEWYEDQEGHDCVAAHSDAPPGQVGRFDWDGTDMFSLDTFMLRLIFHASRVTVTVHAKYAGKAITAWLFESRTPSLRVTPGRRAEHPRFLPWDVFTSGGSTSRCRASPTTWTVQTPTWRSCTKPAR